MGYFILKILFINSLSWSPVEGMSSYAVKESEGEENNPIGQPLVVILPFSVLDCEVGLSSWVEEFRTYDEEGLSGANYETKHRIVFF